MASIQGVYIALFGRPADPAGLAYFNGVTSDGGNLSAIGDLAGQKEYTDRFSGMSNTGIINAIYHSLFNRDAEPAGLEFFSAALTKGTLTINNIAIAILDGAQGDDKVIVENKLVAADMFTKSLDTAVEQADYSGNAAADAGRAFLTPVGVEKTTIPSQSAIDAAVTGIHGGHGGDDTGDHGGVIPGKLDIVLTAGDDTVSTTAMADFKTTNGDDTISATHLTFNTGDTIDGGLGNDTFVLKATGTLSVMPHLTDVEKIVVTATGVGSTSHTPENQQDAMVEINLDNSTGYKEVWSDSSSAGAPSQSGIEMGYAAVAFTNIDLGTTLGITGTFHNTPTTFAFKDAGGVADAATLVLDAAQDADNNVTISDIENLTVNVKAASELGYLDTMDAKTITITGSGDLNLKGFKIVEDGTLDASAHSGKLMLMASQHDITIKGGSGDDSFATYPANAGVKMTGGGGSDLFQIWDPANISSVSNASVLKDLNIITDFDGAKDTLDIHNIGANIVLTAAQLTDIGNAASLTDAIQIAGDASKATVSMAADTYSTFVYQGDTYVYHDNFNDGYGMADGIVKLAGFTGQLNSANFIAGM